MLSVPNEFHQLLDAAPDAMVVIDLNGLVTAINVEAERVFGWSERELRGTPMSRFIPRRFQRLLDSGVDGHRASLAAPSRHATISCFARRRDGTEFPVELSTRPLGEGSKAQTLVTLREGAEWVAGQPARARNNEQARATLESIGDAVITTDVNANVSYLNPVAERLTGWTTEEARGQSLDAVLPMISEATRDPIANSALRCLEAGRPVNLEDGVLLLHRDGTEIPIGDSTAPVRNRLGDIIGVVLVIQNESEKRRIGHRLSFEATHDPLTGLVNRREFERRLTRVVTNLSDAAGEHVVMCFDLDRFKDVNDTCGHDAGDALLRSLGPLFGKHLRKRDTLARLGGDEFGVLLENCPQVEAERIAECIRSELEQFRFEWENEVFPVSTSIGLVAVTVVDGGIAVVLRAADAACYSAKEAGGNCVHAERIACDALRHSPGRTSRATRLARAADEGKFQLYVQPIVSLEPDLALRPRFEVLLRLPDGRGRMQAAADFLPQAERYNLMPVIDRWVVRETIALLGEWYREHPAETLPVFSINISASALADESLLTMMEHQLARFGVPGDAICFEIAESTVLADLPRATRFLTAVRAAGCGMALEDFGSGITSFTYLKTFPVDFLKIGGHFIRGIVGDPMYGSIVRAVDDIGRSMGIFTVAKQVGTEPVLERVRELGIGYAQGRALRPPVPFADTNGRVMMPHLLRSA